VRAEVVVKIFGPDLDTADAIAARLRAEMAAIPGLADVQVERQARIPVIELAGDARRAALYGVPPNAVTEALAALANGKIVSQVVEGAQRTEVVLRLDERDRTSAGLSHLLIETSAGRLPRPIIARRNLEFLNRMASTITKQSLVGILVLSCVLQTQAALYSYTGPSYAIADGNPNGDRLAVLIDRGVDLAEAIRLARLYSARAR